MNQTHVLSDVLSDVLRNVTLLCSQGRKNFFVRVTQIFEYMFEEWYCCFTTMLSVALSLRMFQIRRARFGIGGNMLSRILDLEETRLYLGISRTSLYRLRKSGELPVIYVGSQPRVTETALAKYIARQETAAREEAVGF